MDMKAGTRLRSTTSPVEVIVIRCGKDVLVACGGRPMAETHPDASALEQPLPGLEDVVLLGKRYVDEEAGLELLCVKPGVGTLTCEGRPMGLKEAKPLPSSD